MSIIPNAGVYAEGQANAQKAYNTAIGNIQAKRAGLFHQYGMTGNLDPTGHYTNIRTDTHSMYGNLQTMLHNQGAGLMQASNAADERHIGHSGLGNQEESNLRYQYGQEANALSNNFTGGMGGLASEELSAKDAYDQALWQAQMAALQTGIDSGNFTPIPPPPTVTPPTKPPGTTTAPPGTPPPAVTGASWKNLLNHQIKALATAKTKSLLKSNAPKFNTKGLLR